MRLKLVRKYPKSDYTIGNLYIGGVFYCNMLEPPDRGLSSSMTLDEIKARKVKGKTAVPYGVYKVSLAYQSPRFRNNVKYRFCNGRLPRLMNVPGFSGVLIHIGNTAKDTDACLLPGTNRKKGMVLNSTAYFNNLYKLMEDAVERGETITIEITR